MNVLIVGLGKLGAPMAACFASKGHAVQALDLDHAKQEAVNRGESPVDEPGVGELLARHKVRAVSNYGAVYKKDLDIIFIIVPTPSDLDGGFSTRHVLAAAEDLGRYILPRAKPFPLVVLTSTVMPGACQGEVVPALEFASGLTCGTGFGFCYSPEFVALGSVVPDMLNPEFVLIGEQSATAGAILQDFYWDTVDNVPYIERVNLVNAEIAKLALNAYVTTKITFANELARLCERVPGADVNAVTGAIGHDGRVGHKYLTGGTAFGGPCFPRDNRALIRAGLDLGLALDLPETVDRLNLKHFGRLYELIRRLLPDGGTVAVLGLAYKPGTPVTEESVGLGLAEALRDMTEYEVLVHDYVAEPEGWKYTPEWECIDKADLVVVTLPCPEYAEMVYRVEQTVLDCWRILDKEQVEADGARYVALGVGP